MVARALSLVVETSPLVFNRVFEHILIDLDDTLVSRGSGNLCATSTVNISTGSQPCCQYAGYMVCLVVTVLDWVDPASRCTQVDVQL